MRLSELSVLFPIKVVKDGEFHSLGLLSHSSEKMLVGMYDENYIKELLNNRHISCVITNNELYSRLPEHLGIGICEDPMSTFYLTHEHHVQETDFYWKDFPSQISPHAIVHERACIASKNVKIGRGSVIEDNATILERSIIGQDVTIRCGAVVGGEGFEAKYVGGKHINVQHAGGVWIKDRVQVLPNAIIICSVYGGLTEVGEDTVVGPLVFVSHNVRVGRRCEIGPAAVICGSATVEDDVWIGPNATVINELTVGKGAFISVGSVVTKNVGDGQRVSGNFALEHSKFLSFLKSIR